MGANEVRRFCIENYVEPARLRGELQISIRAGDVHQALRLDNRVPMVCDAINTGIFLRDANVELVNIDGPHQGPNTRFTFRLL